MPLLTRLIIRRYRAANGYNRGGGLLVRKRGVHPNCILYRELGGLAHGHSWQSGGRTNERGEPEIEPCAGNVKPDMMGIGDRYFAIDSTMTQEEQDELEETGFRGEEIPAKFDMFEVNYSPED